MHTVRYTKPSPDWFRASERIDRKELPSDRKADWRPHADVWESSKFVGMHPIRPRESQSACPRKSSPNVGFGAKNRAMRDAKKPRFCIVVDVRPSASGGITCTSRRA